MAIMDEILKQANKISKGRSLGEIKTVEDIFLKFDKHCWDEFTRWKF